MKKVRTLLNNIILYLKQQYGKTKEGISYFTLLFASLFFSYVIVANMENIQGFLAYAVVFLIAFMLLCLCWLVCKILHFFLQYYSIWNLFCFATLVFLIFIVLESGITPDKLSFRTAILIALMECIFARCLYALCKNRKYNLFVLVPLILTTIANVGIIQFCVKEGYEAAYVKEFRELNRTLRTGEKVVSYEKVHNVDSFDYGMDKKRNFRTKTVDMTPFFDSYSGIKKWLRDRYWGYGIDKIPLEGKVWYPKEDGTYPILFVIHGNADGAKPSYLGYEYLGKYLAQSGYIVVSVNENWCNYLMGTGFSDENDARAILLLENMKEVLSWNQNKESLLYQKINKNQIAIAGHSRGGEAAAIAYEFNDMHRYLDNGNILLQYHFPIKTIIAIAPTSNQYNPSERTVTLDDVNYFLVHGGNDMDVSNMMGINQYNHVRFSGNKKKMKAYLYVTSANHSQFNTKWGRFDVSVPGNHIVNLKPIMDADEQRTILKQYMKVCLDTTLKGDTLNQDFLYHIDKYGKSLPDTVYIQGYQTSQLDILAGYEEDADLNTATKPGTSIEANRFSVWKETKDSEYSDYDSNNHAVCLEWKNTREGSYEFSFEQKDVRENTLSFDVMNVNDGDSATGKSRSLDFSLQLTDQLGNTAAVQVSNYQTIYPPVKIVYSKLMVLKNLVCYKRTFQTVQIKLSDLQAVNPQLDLEHIKKVSFQFNRNASGKVVLDHIGMS
ncbi:MAG TPA: hypothetical protein DCW90_11435 [Lachnospiraceae bacterium]|nr:hypothetical protein [uncultured Lachnoclostridium sp.]HAU86075.1 hypothetical protein [Lachnospiraceae bacterium]